MKKMNLFLAAAAFSMGALAEVNYQVVPLPQTIQLDESGKTTALIKGQTVGYPADNAQMKRNAEFAREYLGLIPQAYEKKAKGLAVTLSLGLKSENPDAYCITVDKKGVTIQGASESGVFYGIQTLRKSVANEQTDTIALPWATVAAEPRFEYRGCMLDCARHYFPTAFIKTYIDILALHGINKFHWHLTDDQGWRFEVRGLPDLAKKGSYRPHTIVGNNVGLWDADNTIYDDTPEEGYYTQAEVKSAVGRADVVCRTKDRTYVFEFKVDGSAEDALKQIDEKGYMIPYKKEGRCVKVGVNISSVTRTLESWKVAEEE